MLTFFIRRGNAKPEGDNEMWNYDAVIDRQSIRGLSGVEVARMISVKPRFDRYPELDEGTLKDIGFDNSSR
jgi:hypothetical protein